MKLNEILPINNEYVIGSADIDILDVCYDSRKASVNSVFFALPGSNTDGKKFIADAIARGASVIVTDNEIKDIKITQVIVKDIFHYMSLFSAKFFDYPDREMKIAGITGTNGKTTITYMIESILKYLNIECGVIGTINYRYKDKIVEANNTTPQSLDIYKMMRQMLSAGVKNLVIEVSSHALSLGRVEGIDFDIAVFTNLTQDHLDFHKDLDSYYEAKALLFKNLNSGSKENIKYAIINIDDKYGKKLSKINEKSKKILYSAKEKETSDFKAENIVIESGGSKFDVMFENKKEKVDIKHIGLHNVYNALASIASVVCLGNSFENTVKGLNNSVQAPGRLEKVDTKDFEFEVVVDYAHTDDALKNVLKALKELKPKRIITVFGCGGDRDRTKRPLMGKTSVEMSDFVFVTSDNPRTENPKEITLDIEVGIKRIGKKNYKVVVDREEAIKEAIMMAEKGDIVLLAGKGHETYQIIGSQKQHFNDIEIAEKYLEEKKIKKIQIKKIEQKEFNF